MEFAGILPEDAPDPRSEQLKLIRLMPVPIVGLIAQRSLEEAGVWAAHSSDASGYFEMSANINYTLWRNPADRSDPVNLAELDAQTRAAIETVPSWPRPKWLIEQVERMRYPQLWEVVKTTWHRDSSEHTSLARMLVGHTNYLLNNQYRERRGLGSVPPSVRPPQDITDLTIQRGIPVLVDGCEVSGIEIDTDPFVYGIAAELPGGGLLTAVLPRDELQHIRIEFSQQLSVADAPTTRPILPHR